MFPKGIKMQQMLHIYKEYNKNISHKHIMEKYSTFSAVSMLYFWGSKKKIKNMFF